MNLHLRAAGVSAAAALSLGAAACVHFPPSVKLVSLAPPSEAIVFHDVAVFAGTSNELLAHQDVIVRAGRIASVAATQPLEALDAKGARVFEGAGRTLLPGLIDVHTHPTGSGAPFYRIEVPDKERNLQAELYVGVTTIAVAGGDPVELRELSRRIESGQLLGPRLLYAGRIITKKGGYPPVLIQQLVPWPFAQMTIDEFVAQVDTPEQAREAVRTNLGAGATFLKLAVTQLPDRSPRLDQAEIEAAVAVAHEEHRKVVAHVDSAEDALLCARGGVDALWHDVQIDRLDEAQVREIAAHIHTVTPTLSTFDALDALIDGDLHPSALLRATESPALIQSLLDGPRHRQEIPPPLAAWMMKLHANHAGRRANVKALHDAGVTILVGTDADGADGSFPAAIHDELRALTEAGLSNADALLGATSRAARFLDAGADYGTIESGKVADLLLIDGDPLAGIGATAQIVAVLARGKVIERGPGYAPAPVGPAR